MRLVRSRVAECPGAATGVPRYIAAAVGNDEIRQCGWVEVRWEEPVDQRGGAESFFTRGRTCVLCLDVVVVTSQCTSSFTWIRIGAAAAHAFGRRKNQARDSADGWTADAAVRQSGDQTRSQAAGRRIRKEDAKSIKPMAERRRGRWSGIFIMNSTAET